MPRRESFQSAGSNSTDNVQHGNQAQSVPLRHPHFQYNQSASSATPPQQSPSQSVLSSSSTSSLSHALDMHSTSKQGLPLEKRQQTNTGEERGESSRGTLYNNDVWLSSLQPPVTDEEMDRFLASKHWKTAEVGMDEPLEEMLSSHPALGWQTKPNAPSGRDKTLWTDFRTGSSSTVQLEGGEGMVWDTVESRSPLLSEPSLSPSSLSAAFPPQPNDAGSLQAQSDYQAVGMGHIPHNPPSAGSDNLASRLASSSKATYSPQPGDGFSRPTPDQRELFASRSHSSQSLLPSMRDSQQRTSLQHVSPPPTSTRSRSSTQMAFTNSSSPRLDGENALHGIRPRSGTVAYGPAYQRRNLDHKSSLPSSFSSTSPMSRIQESTTMELQADRTGAGTISASLSAELAGLGLDVSDFYPDAAIPSSHDVTMGDLVESSMQRTDSSSSSSTNRTKRLPDLGDSSFLSQATSSFESSGLDDSLLSTGSLNQSSSTRWVHGKDTPPSSPAPSFGPRLGRSPGMDPRSSLQHSSPFPYSRPDEFGVMKTMKQSQMQTKSADNSRTWPRAMPSQAGSSSSPMHHSRSDNAVSGSLSPSMERTGSQRPMSSSSSQSLQERRLQRKARAYSGSIQLGSSHRSNDSLQSDIGPSRSTKVGAEVIEQRRWKRMSASFLSDHDARKRYQEEQSQFDQVSDALDTLRRFLRQRERGTPSSSSPSAGRSSRPVSMIGMSATASTSAQSPPQRTLRHPPSGPLPPRGTLYSSRSDTFSPSPQPERHHQGMLKEEEEERIAALEALAKRVRQMKTDNQRILDDT